MYVRTAFSPNANVTRLEVAVALVKALGLDDTAQALAGTVIIASNTGQSVEISDESAIPSALRGYVQLALDRGILKATFTTGPFAATVSPAGTMTRSSLAFAIDHYRTAFAAELTAVDGIGEALDRITATTCVASSGTHDKMRFTLGLTGLLARFEGRLFSVTEVERGS